jgi:hypothetical protein
MLLFIQTITNNILLTIITYLIYKFLVFLWVPVINSQFIKSIPRSILVPEMIAEIPIERYQKHSGTIFRSLQELQDLIKMLDLKCKADENTTDMIDSLRSQISTLVTLHAMELEIWKSSLTTMDNQQK